jgi:tetratricopeptide (TPR) repeat protein
MKKQHAKKPSGTNVKQASPIAQQRSAVVTPAVSTTGWSLILFILAIALYANTLQHGYVLDDSGVFRDNFVVKKGIDGIPTILKTPYRYGSSHLSDNLYRPLTLVMFAVEWEISPDNPALSHGINVFFYALTCVVLFLFLQTLFPRGNLLPAIITALLWVFHPVHTEVVANIKSRDEIMSALFLFLALLSFMHYLKRSNLLYLAGALTSYFLAFFSKEGVITFLVLFPLAGWYFSGAPAKRIIMASAIMLIPAAVYLIVRQSVLAQYAVPFVVTPADNVLAAAPDAISRFATAVMILGKYLLLLIFPHPLVCDYSYNQIPVTGLASPLFWLSFLIYGASLVLVLLNIRKKSVLVFAALWYLVSMSIYSNLFTLIGTSFAERLLFLPSVGFCLMAGIGISRMSGISGKTGKSNQPQTGLFARNVPAWGITIVVLLLFGIKTIARNGDWKDEWTLMSTDVKNSPKSAHMRHYFGLSLRDKAKEQEDKQLYRDYMARAIHEFDTCVTIYPGFVQGYEELGLAWYRMGDPQKALEYYEKAIQMNSKKATTYSNMAIIFFERQEYGRSFDLYKKAISLDSNFEDGHLNIGSIYGIRGLYDSAIYHFERVLTLNPDNARAYNFIGVTYDLLGKPEKAAPYKEKAALLDPAFKQPAAPANVK